MIQFIIENEQDKLEFTSELEEIMQGSCNHTADSRR